MATRQDRNSDVAETVAAEGSLVGGSGRFRTVLRLMVILVALLMLPAGGASLMWLGRNADRDADRRNAAVDAAEQAAVAVLSYNYASLEKTVAQARSYLTPSFVDEFTEFFATSVAPQAKKFRAVLTTEVISSGLQEARDGETAVVLLYVNQTTRSSELTAPRVDASTVEVRLEWIDDAWLVSGVDPV